MEEILDGDDIHFTDEDQAVAPDGAPTGASTDEID